MLNTSRSGRPRASTLVQPVSASATGLRYSTRSARSVVITASPMESIVTWTSSFSRNIRLTRPRTRVRLPQTSPPRRPRFETLEWGFAHVRARGAHGRLDGRVRGATIELAGGDQRHVAKHA